MNSDKTAILKNRLECLRKTLLESAPKDTLKPITKKMASHFNGILGLVVDQYPDLKSSLPTEISLTTPHDTIIYDYPDANYFDLQAFTEELIGFLTLMESGN